MRAATPFSSFTTAWSTPQLRRSSGHSPWAGDPSAVGHRGSPWAMEADSIVDAYDVQRDVDLPSARWPGRSGLTPGARFGSAVMTQLERGSQPEVLMGDAVPERSGLCARGDHDACPHTVASGGSLVSRRSYVILCQDACHRHRGRSLADRRKVGRDAWDARCTCPGADTARRSSATVAAQVAEQRREWDAIFDSVDLADHPDADTIERRLRDAFLAHGQQPLPDLSRTARIMAALAARPGTRYARLAWLGARGVAGAIRWAWQPGTQADAAVRRDLRANYTFYGALVCLAAVVSAGAVRTSGWRRLAWTVTALSAWLLAARFIALGVVVTTMVRVGKRIPPPTP